MQGLQCSPDTTMWLSRDRDVLTASFEELTAELKTRVETRPKHKRSGDGRPRNA